MAPHETLSFVLLLLNFALSLKMPAINSPRKINLARRFANAPSYSPLKVFRPPNESVRALRIAILKATESTEQAIHKASDQAASITHVEGQPDVISSETPLILSCNSPRVTHVEGQPDVRSSETPLTLSCNCPRDSKNDVKEDKSLVRCLDVDSLEDRSNTGGNSRRSNEVL